MKRYNQALAGYDLLHLILDIANVYVYISTTNKGSISNQHKESSEGVSSVLPVCVLQLSAVPVDSSLSSKDQLPHRQTYQKQ